MDDNIQCAGMQVVPIGYGLEKNTRMKYKKEWDMYINFTLRSGAKIIPGRDVPWRIKEMKAYLEWRARSNNVRSLAQIKSKLKHCGLCYNHLLPTAKGEGPSRLKLQLAMVSKEVGRKMKRRLASQGKSAAPKRSLALGKVAISLLFSAYNAGTQSSFKKLSRDVRHHLVTCACMHTGCMRYEMIRQMRKKGEFRWSGPDKCWRLVADWHKMRRRVDTYAIDFPANTRFAAMKYAIYASNGAIEDTFNAAQVLRWQMQEEKSAKARDVFAPENTTAGSFQKWLRNSFKALLAEDEEEVAALVEAMTPHSFRAGMAGDLERENVSRNRIKKIGRWTSDRAMEQYIRGGLAQRLQRIAFHKINCSQHRIRNRRGSIKQVVVKRQDSSEGYDSSSEGYE